MPRVIATNRQKASNRLVAGNRFVVRNFPYSLQYNTNSVQYGLNTTGNTISGFQAWTMGMWVKINVKAGAFQRLLSFGTLTGNQFASIEITSANVWGIGIPGANLTSSILANFNIWQFVVVNFVGGSSGAINLYINNTNIFSSNFGATGIAGTNISEGGLFAGSQAVFANIAQSFIYGRSLSLAEMSQIYFSGVFPSGNLVALYQHTDGSGATVTDTSGNGNNLTLNDAPLWQTDSPMKSRIKVI